MRPYAAAVAGIASLLAVGLLTMAAARANEPPRRVVSMNLCTDQLAMLVAAKEQLYSVSYLSRDPESSVLADDAKKFVTNHGLAEEIFTMSPDLIVAGTFTSRASIALLKRLGFRVEQFAPPNSLSDIRTNMRRMGELLGREKRADELITEFDRALAAVPATLKKRPLAALHYANSYTSGGGTLAADVVERAGLENLGTRLGLQGTTRLPLELLVMEAPDLIISGIRPSSSPALAYDTVTHPALREALRGRGLTSVPDRYLVCGGPFTIEAVRLLETASQKLSRQKQP